MNKNPVVHPVLALEISEQIEEFELLIDKSEAAAQKAKTPLVKRVNLQCAETSFVTAHCLRTALNQGFSEAISSAKVNYARVSCERVKSAFISAVSTLKQFDQVNEQLKQHPNGH